MNSIKNEIKEILDYAQAVKIDENKESSDTLQSGKYITVQGNQVIDCTRLDYLGIGRDKNIISFMQESIAKHDVCPSASQLITKPQAITQLENKLSDWHKLKKTFVFTSGYSVNVNMMQALGMRWRSPHMISYAKSCGISKGKTAICTEFFIEKNSHYSIFHGARISQKFGYSKNTVWSYEDPQSLEKALIKSHKESASEGLLRVIVTDTLNSASGQCIQLDEIAKLAQTYDTMLYLDEAHAVGCIGENGAGLSRSLINKDIIDPKRLLIMGTLTKALAQLGGYISFGWEELADFIHPCMPQYMFSAPLPAWMAETLCLTIDYLSGSTGNLMRHSLNEKSEYVKKGLNELGLNTMKSTSNIIPVLIHDDEKCLAMRYRLIELGFLVAVFRYPAVARGQSRLRISICDDMSWSEIDRLISAFETILNEDNVGVAI